MMMSSQNRAFIDMISPLLFLSYNLRRKEIIILCPDESYNFGYTHGLQLEENAKSGFGHEIPFQWAVTPTSIIGELYVNRKEHHIQDHIVEDLVSGMAKSYNMMHHS